MNDASPSRDTIPSPDEVELLPEQQFVISRLLRSLLSVLAPFLALILVWFAFSALDYRRSARLDKPAQFNTRASLQKVLRDASQVGVAALGMTLIIIAGGIDLSAGAAMSLAATTAAWCFRDSLPAPVGIAAALLTGCLAGLDHQPAAPLPEARMAAGPQRGGGPAAAGTAGGHPVAAYRARTAFRRLGLQRGHRPTVRSECRIDPHPGLLDCRFTDRCGRTVSVRRAVG